MYCYNSVKCQSTFVQLYTAKKDKDILNMNDFVLMGNILIQYDIPVDALCLTVLSLYRILAVILFHM